MRWHRRCHSAITLQIRCVLFTYASYQKNQNKNEETNVLIHIIFAIPPPQNKKPAHQLSPSSVKRLQPLLPLQRRSDTG